MIAIGRVDWSLRRALGASAGEGGAAEGSQSHSATYLVAVHGASKFKRHRHWLSDRNLQEYRYH